MRPLTAVLLIIISFAVLPPAAMGQDTGRPGIIRGAVSAIPASIPTPAPAETFKLEFDHANILVRDLAESSTFYLTILQLEELETPWGQNPSVRFFSLGGHQQLHVAQVNNQSVEPNKVIHIAFATGEFDAYLVFLRENGIEYTNFGGDSSDPQVRPDGVRQVYFQDPDGNWIEVNDASY